MRILLMGGRQRGRTLGNEEWSMYEAGLGLEVSVVDDTAQICIEHTSAPELIPDVSTPSIVFKSASVAGDRLHACTQTEVLEYDLASFEQVGHVSLPLFNDVHHVRPASSGNRLVAVTGLDLVVELSAEGEVIREWSAVEQPTWERFSKTVDYRRVETTKPHGAHPNYVFEARGQYWVTRFEQRDAICLTDPSRPSLDIGVERPHDGVVVDDSVYFTTVDGHIVTVDINTGKRTDTIDLAETRDDGLQLGWCRGLEVLADGRFLIGFSRIRPTRLHANLQWVKRRVSQGALPASGPTRVVLYDPAHRRIDWQFDVESYGLNTIFSVHLLDGAAST